MRLRLKIQLLLSGMALMFTAAPLAFAVTAVDDPCQVKPGDYNQDVAVNVLDVVKLVQHVLSPQEDDFMGQTSVCAACCAANTSDGLCPMDVGCQQTPGDSNEDASVNVLDVVHLVSFVLGTATESSPLFKASVCGVCAAAIVTPEPVPMTLDEEVGQVALLFLQSDTPEMLDALNHFRDELISRPWTDGFIAIAVAAGDQASILEERALALEFYGMAEAYLADEDDAMTQFAGHIAYIASRIDDLHKLEGERFDEAGMARLATWLEAALHMDSVGSPQWEGDEGDVGYGALGSEVLVGREMEFFNDGSLRAWQPQLVLGYASREAGSLDDSRAYLEAAVASALDGMVDLGTIQAELVDTLSQLGDTAGASALAMTVISGIAEAVDGATVEMAMEISSPIRRLAVAVPDVVQVALTAEIQSTGWDTNRGMVARLWAATLNVFPQGDISSAATEPTSPWWSEAPAWTEFITEELGLRVGMYLSSLESGDANQQARNITYVTLFHKAHHLTVQLGALTDDQSDYAQALVDESVATLLAMLEAFELESSDHEATWPMAVTGLVRASRDNAARFQMDSPFTSGVLATWSY